MFEKLLATALVASLATLSVAAPTPSEQSIPSSINDTLALSSSYSVVDQCDCPAAAVSWVIIHGQCTCEYPSTKAPQVKEKRDEFPPACVATTHCTNGDRLIYTSVPNSCFCWQPSRNPPPSKRAVASLVAADEKKQATQTKEKRKVPDCVATTHCTNGDRLIYTDVPNSCFCWQPSRNRPPSERAVASLEEKDNEKPRHATSNNFDDDDELSEVEE